MIVASACEGNTAFLSCDIFCYLAALTAVCIPYKMHKAGKAAKKMAREKHTRTIHATSCK